LRGLFSRGLFSRRQKNNFIKRADSTQKSTLKRDESSKRQFCERSKLSGRNPVKWEVGLTSHCNDREAILINKLIYDMQDFIIISYMADDNQ